MFKKIQNIHFVGIGGIGMSGIAEVLLNQGYAVSGLDPPPSATTERLASLGARVFEGHRSEHLEAVDVVVISSAVRPDNPEVLEAQRRQIPIIPRAEMLAELMRMKYGITVAGTHGKTTTTSMVAGRCCRKQAWTRPSWLGADSMHLGSNARMGTGDFMVVEADESDRSFLMLSPTLAVVTNVDEDHMESYAGLDDLKGRLRAIRQQGAVLWCGDSLPRRAELAVSYPAHQTAHRELWLQRASGPKHRESGVSGISIPISAAVSGRASG